MNPIFRIPPVLVDFNIQSELTEVPWHVTDHHMQQFWPDSGAGKGVTVAVLDTGIDASHPEFADVTVEQLSAYGDGGVDRNSHGTHVCGIIAGKSVGLAPSIDKLISIKVLDDQGSGSSAAIAAGIDSAVEKGADIVNMSFSSSSASQDIAAACRRAYEAGVALFAATGNDSATRVSCPANFDDLVIAVGAVDRHKNRATFSNYDDGRLIVDLVDYGVQIASSIPGGKYQRYSGTSMATPMAVAMAANRFSRELAAKAEPTTRLLTRHKLLSAICEDLGSKDRDHQFGWGQFVSKLAFGPDAWGINPGSEPDPSGREVCTVLAQGGQRSVRFPDGSEFSL